MRHLLAGLRAGVNGALAMLLLSMIGTMFSRHSIWSMPNLLATTFYGENAYRWGFHRPTTAGLALFFVLYGLLGSVWGLVIRDDVRGRMTLLSAIYGLAVFYLLFRFVWPHVNPLVAMYSPEGNLRLGHLLWGLTLSRAPRYARYILDATSEPEVVEVPEIKSGEVMQ